jgi:CysZ protein
VYNPSVGFFRGFLAPFRGAAFISRQRLWRYLVLPVAVNLALGIVTLVAAARFFREEYGQLLASSPVVGGILLLVMTVLGGVVLFIVAQPLLSAVFCDRLSEVVEKRVRGSAPSVPFLASTGRSIVHGLLKLVLYALALVVGLALTAVTGVGSLIGLALGALFLAYDGFDYSLSRRGATFAGKWGYLARNPAQTIGYGAGATLLYLIPLAMFVAPAFTAAGATLAYLDVEAKVDARRKPDAPVNATAAAAPTAQADSKQDDPAVPPHNPIDISAS